MKEQQRSCRPSLVSTRVACRSSPVARVARFRIFQKSETIASSASGRNNRAPSNARRADVARPEKSPEQAQYERQQLLKSRARALQRAWSARSPRPDQGPALDGAWAPRRPPAARASVHEATPENTQTSPRECAPATRPISTKVTFDRGASTPSTRQDKASAPHPASERS